MILIVNFGKEQKHGHAHASERKPCSLTKHRLVEMVKFLCTFTFAWCSLTGCTWAIMHFQNLYGWTHIWMEVQEALVVSFLCVFIIYILDKVADLEFTSDEVDEIIRDSVLGFGVLIGFCWEHAFDVGVISITHRVHEYKEIAQFFMCSFIAAIVLPAYIMYIVPIQFKMTKPATGTETAVPTDPSYQPTEVHAD